MLRNRVMTALLLGPLVIAAILFLPPDGFALFWGAIILAAAWEWTNLSGLANIAARIGFVGAMLAILGAARYFAVDWAPGELPGWFYWPVVVWWFAWGMAMRMVPERLTKLSYPLSAKLLSGAFVLISGWALMVWLRLNFRQEQVLYLVMLIWVADAAAYFVGKRFGLTKLLEPISPGKTVEGVYGALFAAAVLALAVGFAAGFEAITVADFVFLSLLTVVASVCGDLFESLAKRIRGVKDSSTLLPGHGGVLDRIDSLLAAVAVFYVGSLLMGIFLETTTVYLPADLTVQQEIPKQSEDDGRTLEEKAVPMEEGGFLEEGKQKPGPAAPSQQESQ